MIMGIWSLEQPVSHDHKVGRSRGVTASTITTVIMGIWSPGHVMPSPIPRRHARRPPTEPMIEAMIMEVVAAEQQERPDHRSELGTGYCRPTRPRHAR